MVTTIARPALPARVTRSPRHPFKLQHKPWVLQPFLLAPVLPGETMKNLLIQSRAVSDPITDPLAGWWLEYYIFYVKLTDLAARTEFQEMLIKPDSFSNSGLVAAAVDWKHYTAEGGIRWSELCLQRVTEEFFRNEGETWNAAAIGGLPLAAVAEDRANWMQSLIMGDDLVALDVSISTAGDNAFTMSELEAAKRDYDISKMFGLTEMTWEDYLEQNGVRTAVAQNPHRPELLRHVREWTYPSNTIDPTNGTPRSAISYAVAERADKNRFFTEPGFIFGVTVCRPKVYYRNLGGSPAGFMQSPQSWLPASLVDDAWSSMTTHITTSGSGPSPIITDAQGYAWDNRDLLLYGDQFVNFDPSAAIGQNMVALPSALGLREYPAEADIDGLFVSPTADMIRQDGVVSLQISGRQRDTTPPGSTGTFMV